jgi:C4-dicarboxylate transporter
LLIAILVSFAMATPDYLINKKSIKAIRMIPGIFLMMCLNYFKLRGVNSNFIHTKKG